MITKNSFVKLRNLAVNHELPPVKSNPENIDFHVLYLPNKVINRNKVIYNNKNNKRIYLEVNVLIYFQTFFPSQQFPDLILL